ncbi:MAG: hypothetical protein RR115_07205 [Hydrogenoanaerobacterium sp.]
MKRNSRGMPYTVAQDEELAQRAIIRLTVRRGSFAADKALGSELYSLGDSRIKNLNTAAFNMVRQALLPISEFDVLSTVCTKSGENLLIKILLNIGDKIKKLEVNMNI